MHVDVAGERMQLLPQRAMFWLARSTLLIADTHFGKDATFRRAGVPVPIESLRRDLDRLGETVALTGCERLMILGDFYHARSGRSDQTEQLLTRWFAAHRGLEVTVLEGNHDVHAGSPRADWGLVYRAKPQVEIPFAFMHDVDSANVEGVQKCVRVGGHLHPAMILRGPVGATRKVPCFVIGEDRVILPAFAGFTGGKTVRPRAGERLVPAVAGSETLLIHTDVAQQTSTLH